jgi:hypothetical protein
VIGPIVQRIRGPYRMAMGLAMSGVSVRTSPIRMTRSGRRNRAASPDRPAQQREGDVPVVERQ